ncbi:MAG: DNA polymerase IV [Bacteriovoracaceae bacterium]|nr:DNA polymerase IV [Bacteriovoracaceae bacterium]
MSDHFTKSIVSKVLNQDRHIIHIDMDCFYAAVEMRDFPNLRDIPIAIGGKGRRSVLSTSNYHARKFGVRSAMPSMMAMKLCPHLTIVPGRHSLYKEESLKINEIFHNYTDLVQPLSLDEAFLDVTELVTPEFTPDKIAESIRNDIFTKTQLTASAGISPNKFLSKVASDWNKPNGQLYIPNNRILDFIEELPLRKIPGVGPKSMEKLERMGLRTCGDIQEKSIEYMSKYFGKHGLDLYKLSFGLDNRPIRTESIRKSLSVETTFGDDISGWIACFKEVKELIPEVARRLLKYKKRKEIKKNILKSLMVKVKFHDFQTVTVERTCPSEMFDSFWDNGDWSQDLEDLLMTLLKQGLEKGGKPVRLLGIGFKIDPDKLDEALPIQLNLFHEPIYSIL